MSVMFFLVCLSCLSCVSVFRCCVLLYLCCVVCLPFCFCDVGTSCFLFAYRRLCFCFVFFLCCSMFVVVNSIVCRCVSVLVVVFSCLWVVLLVVCCYICLCVVFVVLCCIVLILLFYPRVCLFDHVLSLSCCFFYIDLLFVSSFVFVLYRGF